MSTLSVLSEEIKIIAVEGFHNIAIYSVFGLSGFEAVGYKLAILWVFNKIILNFRSSHFSHVEAKYHRKGDWGGRGA